MAVLRAGSLKFTHFSATTSSGKKQRGILRLAAAAEPIQRKLRQIAAGDFPVSSPM